MKRNKIKEDVLKEIEEGFNFIERLKVRLSKKLSIKIYKKGVQKGFNWSIYPKKQKEGKIKSNTNNIKKNIK